MNLISALKKFKKVTRLKWEKDGDSSCVFLREDDLVYKDDGITEPSAFWGFYFARDSFLADDWIEYTSCPVCKLKHTCGRSND